MDATNTEQYEQMVEEAAQMILTKLGSAKVVLVLGSGLGPFTDYLEDKQELSFADIPHVPTTSVVGHTGKLIRGSVSGQTILCLAGRTHAYEGYKMYQLTFMPRVMKRVGCELYIATNSSGGAQAGMTRGCIMAIRDHMNCFKRNPLYDLSNVGERHQDSRLIYSTRLLEIGRATAREEGVQLFEGVYCGTSGPVYETFTEVEVGAKWGGSAFGMSTVPETSAAASEGMEVFGCSMITNLAAGIDDSSMELTHDDVTETAGEFAPDFTRFMLAFLKRVSTVRVRETVNPLSNNMTLPLPQPVAPAVASQKVIEESAQFVWKQAVDSGKYVKGLPPTVAVYVSNGMDTLISYLEMERALGLKDVVDVKYSDIPNFPTCSLTGRQGKIGFANVPPLKEGNTDTAVLFLYGNTLESFNCEEGVFIALLLAELGVQSLVHTFYAGGSSATVIPETVCLLEDASDWGTLAPLPSIVTTHQYNTIPLFNTGDNEDVKLSFVFAGVEQTPASYIHFQGPSFPTAAETGVARRCNIELVGITSLHLVYSARVLGIDVTGLAGVTHSYGDAPLTDASYVLWKKFRRILHCLLRTSFLSKNRKGQTSRIQWKPEYIDARNTRQLSYHLNNPVTQGDYDVVTKSAEHLKGVNSAFASPDLFLLVDTNLNALEFPGAESLASLDFSEVPGFPEGHGTISLFRIGKKTLLCVHGTFVMNRGRAAQDIGHATRVAKLLGASKMLTVYEVASYEKEMPLGSWVLIKDHFNLSGRSPLFGPNEPRFGVRFTDMGNLYTESFRILLRRSAQIFNLPLPEAICAGVVGPVFHSRSDARLVRGAGCQVASTGLVPEVTVARHSGFEQAAIGVVVAQVFEGSPTRSRSQLSNPKQLGRLISKSLQHL